MSSGSLSALIGVIVGGALTLAVQVILELIRDARKTAQLSHAIAGEISAVLGIIAARNYIELIDSFRANAASGNAVILKLNIERTYFPVIEANLQHIGMLPVEIPLLISRFLTASKSALEDVSALNKGVWDGLQPSELELFYEALSRMLRVAIQTGHEIITIVAMLYGSPHGRYPIGVKLKMICIKLLRRKPKAEDTPF